MWCLRLGFTSVVGVVGLGLVWLWLLLLGSSFGLFVCCGLQTDVFLLGLVGCLFVCCFWLVGCII